MCGLWNLSQGRDVYPATVCVSQSYPALLSAVPVPLSSCCRDPSVCSKLKLPPASISWWPRWPPTHWWHRWLILLILPTLHILLQCTHTLHFRRMLPAIHIGFHSWPPGFSHACQLWSLMCWLPPWALVKNLHILKPSNSCSMLRSALFCSLWSPIYTDYLL